MKALETTKLVEVTLVIAIETYGINPDMVSPMDYIEVHGEGQLIGYTTQDLQVTRKGNTQ